VLAIITVIIVGAVVAGLQSEAPGFFSSFGKLLS